MVEVNESVEVDTGTGWLRAEMWLNEWDGSEKQPSLLSFADPIFFPRSALSPFPISLPGSFPPVTHLFFHSWYPHIYIAISRVTLPTSPPAPINLLLSSVLCHSIHLHLALLRKIRFVAFQAGAPNIMLTELSHLFIRCEELR